MRNLLSSCRGPFAAPLFLGAVAIILTGCSSPKPKEAADQHRGWIGGQYRVVRQFPPEFKHPPKAALLITTLRTNTPAQLAGLGEGDLILELNHQPATRLRRFYRTIDRSEPGALLPVKAWRDGQAIEVQVPVGRETYNRRATLGIGLPPKFVALGLWPSPDFSLVVLGYETESLDSRFDLGSASERYFKRCDPKNYLGKDEDWSAWLAILWADVTKQIRCQENVAPRAASRPLTAAARSQ
jgi:membrane-associated protease RseP (regulator of RpoE activity)